MKRGPVKLFSLVKVAKPVKKAWTMHEVFSTRRLIDRLPYGRDWVVSSKEDGIRCQLHNGPEQVKLLTDEGGVIRPECVQPIIAEIKRMTKSSCIFDGELKLYLGGRNQSHEGVKAYITRKRPPTTEELAGIVYRYWDKLWKNGRDLTMVPYLRRFKMTKFKKTPHIEPVDHKVVLESGIPSAGSKVASKEGFMVRDAASTYWQDNLIYKVKKTYDVDVKIVKMTKRTDGWTYTCANREGDVVGETYKQTYLVPPDVKVGDVIRVTVTTVSRKWDPEKNTYTYHWYSPTPVPAKGRLAQLARRVAKGRPKRVDPRSLFHEIWLATKARKFARPPRGRKK